MRVNFFSFVFITVILFTSGAMAVPLYYTFSGTVSSYTQNGSSFSPSLFSVNEAVSYTFLLDRSLDGGFTEGTNQYIFTDDSNNDYFYAEYVDGSAINMNSYKTCNYVRSTFPGDSTNSGMVGSAGSHITYPSGIYNFIQITGPTGYYGSLDRWVVGETNVTGDNQAQYGSDTARVRSDLILTSITEATPPNPTPEPATTFFIGCGIAIFAAFKRRFLQ